MKNLEHRTLELLKQHNFSQDTSFLLGVSGGKDSMALFYVFLTLSRVLKFSFSVAHVHHGPNQNPTYEDSREKSFHLVKKVCEKEKIEFSCNYDEVSGDFSITAPLDESEKGMRDFRYLCFSNWKKEKILVLAHHSQDLLETRLLRLIRGVGGQGLVAMKVWGNQILRPFLFRSLSELEEYIKEKKIPFQADPSNQDLSFFRNWLRHKWIQDLEDYQKGSTYRLSQSLDCVLENLNLQDFDFEEGISREIFDNISHSEKKILLASYMKSLDLKDYGQSHVDEILKRYEVFKKDNSHNCFFILGRKWMFFPTSLQALPSQNP